MKIALFFDFPSGGAKRALYEQVRRLAQEHDIDLYSLSCSDQSFADVRSFVSHSTIEPFEPSKLFRSPWGRLNNGLRMMDLLRLRPIMRRIADRINRGGYDIALVYSCQMTCSPALLRFLQIPTLYYRHDLIRWLQDPPIRRPYHRETHWRTKLNRIDPLRSFYDRLLIHEDSTSMRSATRVLSNSSFVRESLYRIYGIVPFVSYLGVDVEFFRPLKLARQDFVLSVGALTPGKGYDFLIESLGRVPETRRPPLVIVSNLRSEDEAKYLQGLADRHRVQVQFETMVEDQRLPQLYNQARCVVYTPVLESFGLVALESMACGTPVVGINEGGVRETVIHGKTGVLVDRDPEDFARAIMRLLDDPLLSEELGRQGREYVEKHWTWDQSISTLNAHLTRTAGIRRNA